MWQKFLAALHTTMCVQLLVLGWNISIHPTLPQMSNMPNLSDPSPMGIAHVCMATMTGKAFLHTSLFCGHACMHVTRHTCIYRRQYSNTPTHQLRALTHRQTDTHTELKYMHGKSPWQEGLLLRTRSNSPWIFFPFQQEKGKEIPGAFATKKRYPRVALYKIQGLCYSFL